MQHKLCHVHSYGYGSKNRYQNETLVSGNMDQNLRNPSSFLLSHCHIHVDVTCLRFHVVFLKRGQPTKMAVLPLLSLSRQHNKTGTRSKIGTRALHVPCKPSFQLLRVWRGQQAGVHPHLRLCLNGRTLKMHGFPLISC